MTDDKTKRSPAMEEIYRSSPDPLVRGANLVFALVLVLMIVISTQVKFTQTVHLPVTLAGDREFTIGSSASDSRVTLGQSAVVTTASYPPEKYGYLKGRVGKNSDGSTIIKLDDAAGSKDIPLTPGLQGNAEVVVGEESLLKRVGSILF